MEYLLDMIIIMIFLVNILESIYIMAEKLDMEDMDPLKDYKEEQELSNIP